MLPGTTATVALLDEGVFVVDVRISEELEVRLPDALWAGVRFSRGYAGCVMGAPALAGHSGNLFARGRFGCGLWLGDYPAAPRASFYAGLWAREPYASEFAVRGNASFDFDLRSPDGLDMPGDIIASTQGTVTTSGNGPRQVRMMFDPPLQVPWRSWFSLQSDTSSGRVVASRRALAMGDTSTNRIAAFEARAWQVRAITETDEEPEFGLTIRCAGKAPIGACCDTIFLDEFSRSDCREVAEANCPYTCGLPEAVCLSDPFEPRCVFEIVGGGCYKVRVSDDGGRRPSGQIRIRSRSGGLCPAGAVAWISPPPDVIDAGIPFDPSDPPDLAGHRSNHGADAPWLRLPPAGTFAPTSLPVPPTRLARSRGRTERRPWCGVVRSRPVWLRLSDTEMMWGR